jgi:hypothetical protein
MWHAQIATRHENAGIETDFYRRPSNVIRRSASTHAARSKATRIKIAVSALALGLLAAAAIVSPMILAQDSDWDTVLTTSVPLANN